MFQEIFVHGQWTGAVNFGLLNKRWDLTEPWTPSGIPSLIMNDVITYTVLYRYTLHCRSRVFYEAILNEILVSSHSIRLFIIHIFMLSTRSDANMLFIIKKSIIIVFHTVFFLFHDVVTTIYYRTFLNVTFFNCAFERYTGWHFNCVLCFRVATPVCLYLAPTTLLARSIYNLYII